MIKQSLTNDGILEKKFKILRTSIMLGNMKNREEILSTYEETARELDKIKRNVYEELLASKMYTTTTLEDEQKRLKNLIDFIQDRINERNEFIDDYIKITSNFLDDLPKVSLENELSDYKIRLDNIDEYLNNCNEIEKLNKRLKNLRDELEEKYESKANNEIINFKLEEELIEEFNKIISRNEYYANLNYTDIEEELSKIDSVLDDKKDVMETFTSSYEALKNAGISGAEREEYLSYVQDARSDYYNELEKKFMLNIYKLVLDKQNDYETLYEKRAKIESILDDRKTSRYELEINLRDDIEYFANLCREQFSIIKAQKFNIENIDKLILDISDCEVRLENLERANNREEILDLLQEYSVDGPKIEKIELPEERQIIEDGVYNNIDVSSKPSNMVVKIEEPLKINVKTASDTAKLVMKKVVIVLEPKKFNNKKDKIKEAEKELEERKRKEKILEQERKLEEEFRLEEEKRLAEEKRRLEENNINEVDALNKEEESNFIDLDVNNDTDEISDNVFVDFNDDLNIKLDTKEVDDKGVKDTIILDEIKINVPDSNEISIPTEIFIEEPPKEDVIDLFSETDPFLDDNQFEIDETNIRSEETLGNMPEIKNIGTVKPNSMLSKIEDVAKENNDIILPTLGLTNNDKVDVPIVSENYIN